MFGNGWGRTRPPPGLPVDWSHPLSEGLLRAWVPGQEGALVADRSGRAAPGIVRGATPAAGPEGATMTFNGTSNDVLLLAGRTVCHLPVVTVAMRFRTTGTDSPSGRPLYCERAAANNPIWKIEWSQSSLGGAALELVHRDDGGGLTFLTGVKVIDDGLTHSGVLVKSGQAAALWVDGALDASTTLSGGDAMTDPGIETRLGSDAGDSNGWWSGQIDHAYVYTRALAGRDVATLYQRPYDLIWKPRFWYIGAQGGAVQDTPELRGRPFGQHGQSQMQQLLAQ